MKQVYLQKDSDDLISHCRCKDALVGMPVQADCPWCGCGWLFVCMSCNKAFTFARAIEVDESLESLVKRGLGPEAPQEYVNDYVAELEEMLADVEVGKTYVYFDGALIPTDADGFEFDGIFASHSLGVVPQVEALSDPSIIEDLLKNANYWHQFAHP